jgi:hypothetical protein
VPWRSTNRRRRGQDAIERVEENGRRTFRPLDRIPNHSLAYDRLTYTWSHHLITRTRLPYLERTEALFVAALGRIDLTSTLQAKRPITQPWALYTLILAREEDCGRLLHSSPLMDEKFLRGCTKITSKPVQPSLRPILISYAKPTWVVCKEPL